MQDTKCKTDENWIAFKAEINIVSNYYFQSKRLFQNRLNPKVVRDNKHSGKF